jgi:hypothetical protein
MDAKAIRRYAVTIAIIVLFGAWVWSGMQEMTQVECEVCVEFRGRRACRAGLGENEKAARRAAQSTACAPLTSGVTEGFACDRAAPASVSCRKR